MKSQIGTLSQMGEPRYAPYVFTERGVNMISGVLRSEPERDSHEMQLAAVAR